MSWHQGLAAPVAVAVACFAPVAALAQSPAAVNARVEISAAVAGSSATLEAIERQASARDRARQAEIAALQTRLIEAEAQGVAAEGAMPGGEAFQVRHERRRPEAGGVRLNVKDDAGVAQAVAAMAHLSERFLVEKMVTDAVAEIIVGVHRDAQFGLALTVGAGGVFVELLKDTVTLLLPVTRAEVGAALASLKTWPLVSGYRSRAQGDVDALLDAVMAIAAYAQANSGSLEELDVNPLMVRPQGEGVLAVDAMVRIFRED